MKEQSLDALMDAAPDGIILIDERGGILRLNRSAEHMFGFPEQDMLGRNVSELMPEPHRTQHDKYLEQYLKTGQARIIGVGRETQGLKASGEIFPILLSVGETEGPGPTRFVGIIRDLTEEKQAADTLRLLEGQLLHADRLIAVGELTAGIAHEINQPLTAIAAFADAGKSMIDSGRTEDLKRVCARVAEQARRAGEVVQRLRRLTRVGAVSKNRHTMMDILKNIPDLFEFDTKKHGINLVIGPVKSDATLFVDDIQVQQILVNLVKNSVDAITGAGVSGGEIHVNCALTASQVEIRVSDNGPGVDESKRDQLFEPFFTTKPGGVGLGLSICRNIAAAHGGALSYRPAADGGACFSLTLPLEHIG